MADKDEWSAFGFNNILPMGVIKALDKAISGLSTAIKALNVVLGALKFFISAFSSFSILLQTFINFAQKTISDLSKDLLSGGVYFNILVPPAFLKSLTNPKFSAGGYNGFLSRMKVSLNNPADQNAPNFSDDAQVGGFIILMDTETLVDFFKGLDFLNGLFDFFSLFPINTSPVPPGNIKAISGYYTKPDTTDPQLGIKLTWDAPGLTGFTNYRISRSSTQRGVPTTKRPVPTRLFAPKGHPATEGLLKAVSYALSAKPHQFPEVIVREYHDLDFNDGKPAVVLANPINYSGGYIDFDIDKNQSFKKYYYVIESGFAIPPLWGPRSAEVMGTANLANCINENQHAAVEHPGNNFELISSGFVGLGSWSSIQTKAVLPFLETTVNLVNKFLAGLAGAIKTNTKSFLDFIKGIADKIKDYTEILHILIMMITAIENFFSGAPKVAFLNVPPATGGTAKFISRVTNATPPEGGFSGKNGFTCGIVFVYGEVSLHKGSMSDAEYTTLKTALKVKSDALGKAFRLLMSVLTKG